MADDKTARVESEWEKPLMAAALAGLEPGAIEDEQRAGSRVLMADTVIGVTAGEIERDGESHEERNGGGIGGHSLAREGPGAGCQAAG